MTSTNDFNSRNHDNQDGIETHVWGKLEYLASAGAMIKVRGTDTEDQEAMVINLGQSFNLPENSDTEVLLLAMGSDTNKKFALLTIPRDKQRKWAENTGGVQNPTDGDKAVELNSKRIHNTDPNFAVGAGLFEVVGGNIVIRGNVSIDGTLEATGDIGTAGNLRGVDVQANETASNPATPTVPGFSP